MHGDAEAQEYLEKVLVFARCDAEAPGPAGRRRTAKNDAGRPKKRCGCPGGSGRVTRKPQGLGVARRSQPSRSGWRNGEQTVSLVRSKTWVSSPAERVCPGG